jgi:DNA processing protein
VNGGKKLDFASPGDGGHLLSDAQKLAWLRLIRSENVGPITFRNLINRYGSASDAIEAIPELSARGGIRRAIRICPEDQAEAELDAAAQLDLLVIALGEPNYPMLLQHIDGAPPLLFVRGHSEILTRPSIAIVGSRNCSAAGALLAGELASGLAEAGLVIVSGLARGIDASAHKATLATGTIAVLAGGADTVYPENHIELASQVAETGALISEMPIGYLPRGRDFPRRNRIISGTAIGTVVVEAAVRSGSLITARLAGEQGRDIFAVPGSPRDPRTEGTNRLLKQGAQLVTSYTDILESIASQLENPTEVIGPSLDSNQIDSGGDSWNDVTDDDRSVIVQALSPAPVTIDEIVRHTDRPAGDVISVLMELELAGRVARHPGQRVSLL